MALLSTNPATGDEIARYDAHAPEEIERRLECARAAFVQNRADTFAGRSERMARAADLFEGRARELGALMTREMGKPISQSIAEAKKCAVGCRYYARHAETFLADESVEVDGSRTYVAFQPLGPILAIMPWNFPFWQVVRFAAPALMAGNAALLKHASNVTGCALAIESLLREAGFDQGEFQALLISSSEVPKVIADSRVRATTLTGSVAAGRSVGQIAGKAIKPSVLELGGSDPFVVLKDADLDSAVEVGVRARMQNNGQSCIAAKRFIVEEPVWEAFTKRFVERVRALEVGDPMDEKTAVGPLAREDLRREVHDQVTRSVRDGAKLLAGGEMPDGAGFYYPPTVLSDVEPGTVAFTEEIFGPVAALTPARDADHAVELANATEFGLGGAVFTRDLAKGEDVARRLEVGCAFVNEMVKSDPKLPFGGIKASGYGRELSHFGIRAFVNVKTVWIR